MEAIGRLTGGISHDFNNLLQAIGGYTQLLLMSKQEDDPDRKHLASIGELTQNATELVKQLMLFSRQAETVRQALNLNDEINKFNLHFKYPNATSMAVNGVSIRIKKGESIGFIGTSGSGKSTLKINRLARARVGFCCQLPST